MVARRIANIGALGGGRSFHSSILARSAALGVMPTCRYGPRPAPGLPGACTGFRGPRLDEVIEARGLRLAAMFFAAIAREEPLHPFGESSRSVQVAYYFKLTTCPNASRNAPDCCAPDSASLSLMTKKGNAVHLMPSRHFLGLLDRIHSVVAAKHGLGLLAVEARFGNHVNERLPIADVLGLREIRSEQCLHDRILDCRGGPCFPPRRFSTVHPWEDATDMTNRLVEYQGTRKPGAAMILTVDVISDVICPWCFIGKRRLKKAVASLDRKHDVRVRWLPFQMNPSMPKEGIRRRDPFRAAKRGIRSHRVPS